MNTFHCGHLADTESYCEEVADVCTWSWYHLLCQRVHVFGPQVVRRSTQDECHDQTISNISLSNQRK